MRVGLISYDFYPPLGGQGVEVKGLYDALRAKGDFQPIVVSAARNDIVDHLRIPVRGSFAGQIFFSVRLSRELERIVQGKALEILQVYGGPGGVLLTNKPSVPLVYVANHTYAQQYRFIGKAFHHAMRRLEARGYHAADMIVAISTDTASSLIDDYGVPPDRVEVIPVGVNTGTFYPGSDERLPGSVLFVGRLCERKGLPLLLDAMRLLLDRSPHSVLHLIGEGGLRHDLEKYANRLGIQERIRFHGKIDDEQLAWWYRRAEVFVLPSLFEGFGIVCVEAMACGTPVVATRVPGVMDIIEDGRSGFLVDRDPRLLADAIYRVLSDKRIAHSLSNEGRRDVTEKFGWAAIANRFGGLYSQLVHFDQHAPATRVAGEVGAAGTGTGEV